MKNKTVAIYARVSTGQQKADMQIRELRTRPSMKSISCKPAEVALFCQHESYIPAENRPIAPRFTRDKVPFTERSDPGELGFVLSTGDM